MNEGLFQRVVKLEDFRCRAYLDPDPRMSCFFECYFGV